MGHKFHELVRRGASVEKELLRYCFRAGSSFRCFISECLSRADTTYTEVEEIKTRLEGCRLRADLGHRRIHQTRDARNCKRPPPGATGEGADRRMGWNQKDQAILELGGQPEKLFLFWQSRPSWRAQRNDVFGTSRTSAAHKARIAEIGSEAEGAVRQQFPSRGRMGTSRSGGSRRTARR